MLFSWLNLGILKRVYGDWLASSGLEGNNNFSCFFFNPKTALSEAPEAGMIFSQYTVFVKTFYQTTYSGKSTEVIL